MILKPSTEQLTVKAEDEALLKALNIATVTFKLQCFKATIAAGAQIAIKHLYREFCEAEAAEAAEAVPAPKHNCDVAVAKVLKRGTSHSGCAVVSSLCR